MVRAALAKRAGAEARSEEALDHAVRRIVSRAVAPDRVMDVFAAAGLTKPDFSILSDELLAEVRDMPQPNLAVELLRKLLNWGCSINCWGTNNNHKNGLCLYTHHSFRFWPRSYLSNKKRTRRVFDNSI